MAAVRVTTLKQHSADRAESKKATKTLAKLSRGTVCDVSAEKGGFRGPRQYLCSLTKQLMKVYRNSCWSYLFWQRASSFQFHQNHLEDPVRLDGRDYQVYS